MSDNSNGAPPSPSQRRKSFVEMLNPRAFSNPAGMPSARPAPSNPVPVSANAPNNRKSMSIALGLSGSAGSDSAFNAFTRQRRASISTTASGSPEFRNSFDDGAVIEDDDKLGPINSPPSPSFARRLSFGAQALRDVRQGGTSPSSNAGRRPSSSLFTLNEDLDNQVKPNPASVSSSISRSPGTLRTTGEGFNWSDAMRDRNKRPSVSSTSAPFHNRSKSIGVVPAEPPKEMPRAEPVPVPAPMRSKKPDHLGERMLRGEFMMD